MSRASSEGFKHGLKIRGLSSTQQEILYDILNLQSKKDGFSGMYRLDHYHTVTLTSEM